MAGNPGLKFSGFTAGGVPQANDGIVGFRNVPSNPSLNQNIYFPISSLVASGLVSFESQTAHGFVAGQFVRVDQVTTKYALAQGDSSVNSSVIGVVSAVIDVNNFILQFGGRLAFSGAAAGAVIFLSPTVAGGYVTTEPSVSGQISKVMGIMDSAGTHMIYLNYAGQVI